MRNLINQIKESIVFLGYIEGGRDRVIGTGFLIQVENIYYLVTAKHVIEKGLEKLCVFLNSKQLNKPISKSLSIVYRDGFYWIKHPNPRVDIAVLPFNLGKDDKVAFIPHNIILSNIEGIHELMDIFYLSYQPGLNSFKEDGCVNPIIRKGTISRINNDQTFFIDGFAFPGNSGSPIFTLSPINGNKVEAKLAGVVGSFVCYEDVAISKQTGKPKIIFEENTGLSLIWSAKFLMEITKSEEFKKQHSTIIKKVSPISNQRLPAPTKNVLDEQNNSKNPPETDQQS